ncbi:hypothetical protein INQ13_23945, partial [Escherichia coli]|uniref:hypothetical protein n=1 Tax=Escherichia coli TaxID=562 RepID=UPI001931963D
HVTYTVRFERVPGATREDAADIAAEWARIDEFRVLDTVDIWCTFDGWQVVLDVEPIRAEVTA